MERTTALFSLGIFVASSTTAAVSSSTIEGDEPPTGVGFELFPLPSPALASFDVPSLSIMLIWDALCIMTDPSPMATSIIL